jgi:hypothetical protein
VVFNWPLAVFYLAITGISPKDFNHKAIKKDDLAIPEKVPYVIIAGLFPGPCRVLPENAWTARSDK